jgi:hypothetical protein
MIEKTVALTADDARSHYETIRVLAETEYGEDARRAVEVAFNIGMSLAISELRPTADVAAELGVTPRLIRRYARQKGVGRDIGRDWLFSREDVEVLKGRKTVPGPARKSVEVLAMDCVVEQEG